MNTYRILLLSNVRLSRTWKIANRITREVPNAEICGIVQRPTHKLPRVQQLIATGSTRQDVSSGRMPSRAYALFQSLLNGLLNSALWFIHGCPRALSGTTKSRTKMMAEKCSEAGWPLLWTDRIYDPIVADFVRLQKPDLTILLGDLPSLQEARLISSCGCIRVCEGKTSERGTEISIEYLANGSDTAFTVARLTVPFQVYEALVEHTLKTDLIADDLVVETAISLKTQSVQQCSEAVTAWAQLIFWPSLQQLQTASMKSALYTPRPRRHRLAWKLSLDTLLLCSPFVIGRNWYRRWRGRYPVLILTHHLVSDRPHRMGMSTKTFWRQVRFLQRHYRIVSLSQAIELLHLGNVNAPTVVLTFDDGYADNFLNLRAVAEELEIPVTHFIVTQPVNVHQQFEHDVEQGERGALPLTWDQIRYWNLRGAEFGSHTRTHFDCVSADRARLIQEIVESKNDIEAQLRKPVKCFAFPFGGPENMSSEAVEIAAATYTHFASGFGGENVHDGAADNQHLFRKNLYQHPWELELELQSVFDLVERIKRKLHLRRVEPPISSRLFTTLATTISRNTKPESRLRVFY